MVRLGWLPLAESLIGDACFLAIFIVLIIAWRRNRSGAIILQTLASGIYVALRIGEWCWQIALNHGWISSSTIRSPYWTWHGIAITGTIIAFTIGFCWEHLSRRKQPSNVER